MSNDEIVNLLGWVYLAGVIAFIVAAVWIGNKFVLPLLQERDRRQRKRKLKLQVMRYKRDVDLLGEIWDERDD
ncbi:hypothetical protein [Tsukamurella spumae]|uniref:Uncharacterized protein n=1 Tax=Tsukamurella spumae TaxID=44753 RepID=A0A846X2Z7_9ACTN|nr:hypothetical protein [Tsukamurella spumae]NKY18895.1 hypothetical protein [Tsukamurella spumae]